MVASGGLSSAPRPTATVEVRVRVRVRLLPGRLGPRPARAQLFVRVAAHPIRAGPVWPGPLPATRAALSGPRPLSAGPAGPGRSSRSALRSAQPAAPRRAALLELCRPAWSGPPVQASRAGPARAQPTVPVRVSIRGARDCPSGGSPLALPLQVARAPLLGSPARPGPARPARFRLRLRGPAAPRSVPLDEADATGCAAILPQRLIEAGLRLSLLG